jgi:hypothetical protein
MAEAVLRKVAKLPKEKRKKARVCSAVACWAERSEAHHRQKTFGY